VFSPLAFSRTIANFQAVQPATVFLNPVGRIFATFSYDKMIDGSQWAVLWYRNGELVHSETSLWAGGSGGYAYVDWNPPPDEWLPGTYQVQIFVGTEWKVVGQFLVKGEAPTLTPSRTATVTSSPSITLTPSLSPTSTRTPFPTWTPSPSDTRWPTPTTGK
jgi:type VI secretion system secreted protein VgrG